VYDNSDMPSLKIPLDWLLSGPPWVQYSTRIDLLGQSEDNSDVVAARKAMMAHPQIRALLSELSAWPGQALLRHNDAGHLLHKFVFLSELGIKANDPGMEPVIKRIMESQSPAGSFQVMSNISPHYGGTGKDQLGWMLCDAPSVLYGLIKSGANPDQAIRSAARHLAGLGFEDGWQCTVSPELGNFRGPGRKTDPCPYATLITLKALSQLPEWKDSLVCLRGAEALLKLWEQRKERRPYLFAMGTDFAKLKAPSLWYDILHALYVLTAFPGLHKDKRLLEMVEIVQAKSDTQGRFTSESIWKAWSDWEFGQKKNPSQFITLQVHRVLKRLGLLK
jgi:hypothetical protein